MSNHSKRPVNGWQGVLLAGALAGSAALGLDLVSARWTLGFPVDLRPVFVAWYLGVGLAAAVLIFGVFRLASAWGRSIGLSHGSAARWTAWSFAAIYSVPVAERVETIAGLDALWLEALVVVAVVGFYLLACGLLERSFGIGSLVAVGVAGSLGLAVHRNVLTSDLSVRSAVLDALVLAGAAGLAAAWNAAPSTARNRARRVVFTCGALGAVLCWSVLAWQVRPEETPPRVAKPPEGAPNVIVLVVDTLRWDVFHRVLDETPEGKAFRDAFGPALRFDRATAVAPWTAPSMASIFTGQYPSRHGFGQLSGSYGRPLRRLDPNVPTLAQALRNRGYRTRAWVTNPILHPATGIGRGFDSYELLQPATTKLPLLQTLKDLELVEKELYQPADALRRRFERSLGELREDPPFLLWLHAMDPHGPLRARPDLQPPVDSETVDSETVDSETPSEDVSRYVGETRHALGELARIIARLREADLWQDSLVVFVSDHGEMMPSDGHDSGALTRQGEPKHYGHGHAVYETLVRVPLWIHPPGGLEEERRISALVSHVDLVPTIAELLRRQTNLDLPFPSDDRVDLLSPDITGRDGVVSAWLQHQPAQRALVGRQLKLIDYDDGRAELYDLESDPRELHDLSAERPDAVRDGRTLLEAHWLRIGASDGVVEEGEAVELDEETRKRLEALGYL